ncbi:NAD(P)/FAD-dependent oxidoreductase [Parathalassolituus penaei]|uniref:FAD-binding oxidoreductase n=1 Tax=Parathalassolituus penaei TaxID=2997323 RepID=A0A9X3IUU2_9GAMM|nr:FAD-binding oxidoreductase [Parathalassolituus penaei]MCY0967299.1 FAD-binding oxidoreductase [Parathalassolituus penaei]
MNNKTIQARRLPRDPGPAAWNSILPSRPSYAQQEGDIDLDWAIIGGGFAGMAAARELHKLVNGESIGIIEACGLADGPSGRNSGFMIDLPHELNAKSYTGSGDQNADQIHLNRLAIEYACSMADEFGFAKGTVARTGRVTAAATEHGRKHVMDYLKHLQRIGEPGTLMSADDMRDYTGSAFYHTGLFMPGTVMIQPAAFIRQAADGLASLGVKIFENSPVVAITPGNPHVLQTRKGKVRARNLILAVNGHIQSFGYFPSRLLHVFTYASMTRKLTNDEIRRLGGTDDWGVLPADPLGTTVRKVSDFMGCGHRIVIRNHASLNQSLEAGPANMARARKLQQISFDNRFPMLKGVEMEHLWGGRLCLSMNSVHAFGELEQRVWSACCQNGLGTVKGTLAGIMAARLATGSRSVDLEKFQQQAAPTRLMPEPFLSIGANAVMRFKEWQAGIEL